MRRYLLEFLSRELTRTARHGRPLALILIDIDDFKSINDSSGHLCGDFILRELAAFLKKNVREEELLARFGGEEFALVIVETTKETALGCTFRTPLDENEIEAFVKEVVPSSAV